MLSNASTAIENQTFGTGVTKYNLRLITNNTRIMRNVKNY